LKIVGCYRAIGADLEKHYKKTYYDFEVLLLINHTKNDKKLF